MKKHLSIPMAAMASLVAVGAPLASAPSAQAATPTATKKVTVVWEVPAGARPNNYASNYPQRLLNTSGLFPTRCDEAPGTTRTFQWDTMDISTPEREAAFQKIIADGVLKAYEDSAFFNGGYAVGGKKTIACNRASVYENGAALKFDNGSWLVNLDKPMAWEIKIIDGLGGAQKIICGQNYGKPCTQYNYDLAVSSSKLTVQIDWQQGSGFNSTDLVLDSAAAYPTAPTIPSIGVVIPSSTKVVPVGTTVSVGATMTAPVSSTPGVLRPSTLRTAPVAKAPVVLQTLSRGRWIDVPGKRSVTTSTGKASFKVKLSATTTMRIRAIATKTTKAATSKPVTQKVRTVRR